MTHLAMWWRRIARLLNMERATKLIVIVSAALALSLEIDIASVGYAPLLPVGIGAFVVSAILAVLVGDLVTSLILLMSYFVPVLALTLTGSFYFGHFAVWQAALFGALIPRSLRSDWAFPDAWKAPLVLWALSLALSWPIVVGRELDFSPPLIRYYRLLTSRAGIPTPVGIMWILNVASIQVLGLLWFDWLFASYGGDRITRFRSRILWPLFAGCVIASIVAVYQGFGHTGFLNPTLYGAMGRAGGTMLDGNVFGTVTAMWLPLATALAFGAIDSRRWISLGCLALPVCLGIALLATGSRTALLTALVGTACLVARTPRSLLANRSRTLIIAGALVGVIVAAMLLSPASTTSGLTRVRWLIPTSKEGLEYAVSEMWDRAGYGTIAARMIAEHPVVGIGLGSFSLHVTDAAYLASQRVMVPDNAQNWYRHQLAETGLLGSVGWIAWAGLFVWMLARQSGPEGERRLVGAAKGAVVGLGITSLFGMPTQDAAVSLTFVVFAFWCTRLTDADPPASVVGSRFARPQWPLLLTVLGCFLAGTAYLAWNELRPPFRGLRADWNYQYGFRDDPALPKPFRWTEGKAVDVFRVEKPWLKLVIGAVAPDASQRPVEVRVWRNHDLILRLNRRSDFALTRYVRVPEGQARMMIQIQVGRTWRPAGAEHERGVAVATWEFVDSPPEREIAIP